MLKLAILIVFALASAAWAQGKPKACFSKAEEKAEQIVREGIRLREGAVGCDGRPYYQNTLPLWQQIDQQFGAQFSQQTKIREDGFRRAFGGDAAKQIAQWNGRTVFHFRHYPLSDTYCVSIKNTLENLSKKGWGALVKQASAGRDEVSMDYRYCQ